MKLLSLSPRTTEVEVPVEQSCGAALAAGLAVLSVTLQPCISIDQSRPDLPQMLAQMFTAIIAEFEARIYVVPDQAA